METLDDRHTSQAASNHPSGIVVVFCGGAAAFSWVPFGAEGHIQIGRGAEHGLDLDQRLSREHAQLAFDGAKWTIRDLDSRNGTFVDGVQLHGEAAFEVPPRFVRMAQTIVLPLADGWSAVTAKPPKQGDLIIGPTLHRALAEIERAAAVGRNVLVTGESGAGKEIAAKTFHAATPNRGGPLVAVNCATIPHGLAERLLFGAKRGAFSGASADVEGYVQAAHGGVLFLDEFGELEPDVQAKLLRVIETKEATPLGATQGRRVDVKFCFATFRNLREAVAAGRFRGDLYYRIAQPEIALPPLRERLEEIPWFVVGEVARVDRSLIVSAELIEACMLRAWPGNVRELLGEARRMADAAAVGPSKTLRARSLSAMAGTVIGASGGPAAAVVVEAVPSAPSARESEPAHVESKREPITKERIEAAFRELHNASAVARELGIHRSHLYRLLKQHGIERSESD